MKVRIIIASIALVSVLSAVSMRLIYLQVINHEVYAQRSRDYHTRKESIPARRGAIYDRHGDLLAQNLPVYDVKLDLSHIRKPSLIARAVALELGESPRTLLRKAPADQLREHYLDLLVSALALPLDFDEGELAQKIANTERHELVLARNYPVERARELRENLEKACMVGVRFVPGTLRQYPSGDILRHVLGFLDHEQNPISGIEKTMDEVLRGKEGYRYVEKNRKGTEIVPFRGEEVDPIDGYHVELTIDMGLQTIVEKEIDRLWHELNPKKVVVMLMRPTTGEILACASRPHFSRRGAPEWNVLGVTDLYEPGSTFKILALAAAMEEKLISPHTQIFCHQGYLPAMRLHDHHPHGQLTAQDVLVKSSNIGCYKIARQLGEERFYRYVRHFGFGQKTGIELPGEVSGTIHPVASWDKYTLSRMAMGHAVAVTPLQMLNALCVIANGGEYLQPQIVRSIHNKEGQEVRSFTPVRSHRVISERTANHMRRAMVKVVGEKGTAPRAAVPGFRVAGKTGTARKVAPGGRGYLQGKYVVSFMGFLPAENPQIAALVVVDDASLPPHRNYGGTVAAPLFSQIAGQAMAYLDVAPTLPVENIAGTPQSSSHSNALE